MSNKKPLTSPNKSSSTTKPRFSDETHTPTTDKKKKGSVIHKTK